MKNVSLKNLNLQEENVLQRNQLKSVLGGHSQCPNNGAITEITWQCADGSASGSAFVCRAHAQAYADVIDAFCA